MGKIEPSVNEASWFDRLLPSRLVLTFHGLDTPRRTIDVSEEPYWVGSSFLAAAIAAARKNPAIDITFDDGNASDYRVAFPMLAEAGLRGTFFVLAGRFDEAGSLTRREVAEMAGAGMGIGSHGHDHVDWTKASDTVMRRELHDARAAIEDCLGARVDSLSIPFGAVDARVMRLILEAGYRTVHTSLGGLAGRSAWFVPRNSVRKDSVMAEELARLAAPSVWLGSALREPVRCWRYGINTLTAVPSR